MNGMHGVARRCGLMAALVWTLALCGCAASGRVATIASSDERVPASGAVDARRFRAGEGSGHTTIFSPLDLPPPNSMRTASGLPGPDYWQQKVDYVIDATLDESARTITARATITYRNNSPDPLDVLWLHLEQNLFKAGSIGARASEPDTRFGFRGFDGGLKDLAFTTSGNDKKPLELEVRDTIGRLKLAGRVPARGGSVTVEASWSFAIPPFGADRMGIEKMSAGEIFEIAQWFPAVCVYDDVHGWNTLPYLGAGEFYTNFGSFDVRLTVPRTHIVACTGVLQNPMEVLTAAQQDRLVAARKSDTPVVIVGAEDVGAAGARPESTSGSLTWHFKADNVRTVAWASSAAFLWDGCLLKGAGPMGADGKPSGVFVQSVYPKEAQPLWGRLATDMLKFSIKHYSEKWFTYPYPTAVNVNGIVGGMEYPMIIFCSERENEDGLYGVTTHEIGHNWFPMIVNTDERRHAWMDEGFNTFVNIYSERARYPDKPIDHGTEGIADRLRRGQQQPMDTPPDQIWRGRLGFLAYRKPAAAMYALRESVMGPERFDRAFRKYIEAWAFKSPRPWDFYRCMESESGMDLAWFWRGWMLGTGTLDQGVTRVDYSEDGKQVRVAFVSEGEMVMPLKFVVKYSDDTQETREVPVEAWATTTEWVATWEVGTRGVREIVVDPDAMLPDVNRANNVWKK